MLYYIKYYIVNSIINNLDLFIRIKIIGFALAALLTSLATTAHETPHDKDSLVKLNEIAKIGASQSHSCHMATVYIQTNGGYTGGGRGLVWNHFTNRPLRCKNYSKYLACLSQYSDDIENGIACFSIKAK